LNDEESYIRIEALEILTEFLNQLTPEDIENEFVKEILKSIEADNEEIQVRLAEIIGKIVF
jgi:chromosomal replication initiation ATPase DnaA